MVGKIAASVHWLPFLVADRFKKKLRPIRPKHVYLCICDHFEPYWGQATSTQARARLQAWIDGWPRLAERHRDAHGRPLRYSFFYPEEEYRHDDLEQLAGLCRAGYGEVEIHLHHDKDTSANLRRTLVDYRNRLHQEHGLLSIDQRSGNIVYGFIHGNWALDNSRPDGRWCGVNDEISILQQTGCYADFTMPSAPSPTQTRQLNSIYAAVDDPERPKSHDTGEPLRAGHCPEGLLMIQGPLLLSFRRRKALVLPRIENGELTAANPVTTKRCADWIDAGVHVQGAADHLFVKLHAHGCQEDFQSWFFGGGGDCLFESLQETTDQLGAQLHFVSARELVNQVLVLAGNEQSPLLRSDYPLQMAGAAVG